MGNTVVVDFGRNFYKDTKDSFGKRVDYCGEILDETIDDLINILVYEHGYSHKAAKAVLSCYIKKEPFREGLRLYAEHWDDESL